MGFTFKEKFGICLSILWFLIGLTAVSLIFGAPFGFIKFIICLMILDCVIGAIMLTRHKLT